MAYRINKTDGTILTDLVDGTLDTTTIDISLIGRNYAGFGEALNENLVKLLENFSSTSAPENAIKGQLWYDASENRLKVYDGDSFVSANGTVVDDVASNVDTGDLFVDTSVDQLKFYNGTSFVTVGPNYTKAQGKTGDEAISVIDTTGVSRVVNGHYVAGVLKGIWSTVQFTPNTVTTPAGWTAGTQIEIGFNPVDVTNYKFHGTATQAGSFVDGTDTYTPASFVRVNQRDSGNNLVDQNIESALFVKGTNGVSVGYQDSKYATLKTDGATTKSHIDVERQNHDFSVRITDGSSKIEAITLDSSERRVGIFNDSPSTTLDITGDVTVSGIVYTSRIETTDSSELIIGPRLNVNSLDVTTATVDNITVTGISTPSLNLTNSWDVSAKQMTKVTASGATTVTLSNVTDIADGTPLTLIVEDAVGATLSLAGATFKHTSGTAPALNGAAGEYMVISMIVLDAATSLIAVSDVVVR